MSGEQVLVNNFLKELDSVCVSDRKINAAYAEDMLFMQLFNRLLKRRSQADIIQQLQYHLTYHQKNLDDDEFVVTRGY